MSMQNVDNGANANVPVNENFETLEHQSVYGKRQPPTTGLTWGYYGGRWGGFSIADGTLTLTNAATNYIVVERADGDITVSTSNTNWNNTTDYARVYQITTAGSVVTAVQDHRAGPNGVHGGGAGGGSGTSGSVNIISETGTGATHVLVPADAGELVRFSGTGAKTVDIDVASGFTADEIYHISNRGASGDVTLDPTGVTLNAPKGGSLVLEPGDTVSVHFFSSSVADVFGSTA